MLSLINWRSSDNLVLLTVCSMRRELYAVSTSERYTS